jgi:hypothetical protein
MPVERFTDKAGTAHTRKPSGSSSKFVEDREVLEKQRKALELYRQGSTYAEIATVLEIGGKQPRRTAARYVEKAMQRWPGAREDADEIRRVEGAKLDAAEAKVWEVLDNPPFSFGSSGRVVIDPVTSEPQRDKSAVLRAVGQLVNISRRRAAMHGIDKAVPVPVRVSATPDLDREIAMLAEQLIEHGTRKALELERGRDWSPADDDGGQGEAREQTEDS